MSEYGHVKISRKAYDTDPFWNEPRVFSKWEAWEWMIQAAAWKDYNRVVGMTIVPLRRGEFMASIRFLCEAWGWKRTRVTDFLRLLVLMERISGQRETPNGSVYLIRNYSAYQSAPDTEPEANRTPERTMSGQRADSERTASGQSRSSKAVKQLSKTTGGASADDPNGEGANRKRAVQLPVSWEPTEKHHDLANKLGVTIEGELEQFKDFHTAKGTAFRDWDAAFRTWLRNAKKFGGRYAKASGDDVSLDSGVWG